MALIHDRVDCHAHDDTYKCNGMPAQEGLAQETRDMFRVDLNLIMRQYRQSPDITTSLIEAAAGRNPDGNVRPAPRSHMSLAEEAALAQSMMAAERQMHEAQRPLSE
jgi:hypothetical protein